MGRGGLLASALQAAHACIDKFGADVAQAEERNAAEWMRIEGAWRRFHEALEDSREAERLAFQRREDARREAREIREGAKKEATDLFEEVRQRPRTWSPTKHSSTPARRPSAPARRT